MAKLIIDIPDEYYEHIKNVYETDYKQKNIEAPIYMKAIVNGTPTYCTNFDDLDYRVDAEMKEDDPCATCTKSWTDYCEGEECYGHDYCKYEKEEV